MTKLLRLSHAFGRKTGSFFRIAPPADLDSICAAAHHGCMGIPQELVDYITDMLRNDFRALVACSLTCKSLFASTRHLIHQTLRLTEKNNESILTRKEKKGLRKKPSNRELCFLSYMAERGFFKYTRYIEICDHFCTPNILLPQIHHFRTFDRVHTLTIEHYDSVIWASDYGTCFVRLYPTITSLRLIRPVGPYQAILQFALQFPNLENLCIETWQVGHTQDPANSIICQYPPPLGGHLRLMGYQTVPMWPANLSRELPNGFNFRSLELEVFSGYYVWKILPSFAHTLEDLIIVIHANGRAELVLLWLKELAVLRRLTLRMAPFQMSPLHLNPFPVVLVLSTIASPTFCEFVLEVDRPLSELDLWYYNGSSLESWGEWGRVDTFVSKRFAEHANFRFIIRTGRRNDQGVFEARTKKVFPLLANMGCIYFETSD